MYGLHHRCRRTLLANNFDGQFPNGILALTNLLLLCVLGLWHSSHICPSLAILAVHNACRDISSNRFSGNVPAAVSSLTKLVSWYV